MYITSCSLYSLSLRKPLRSRRRSSLQEETRMLACRLTRLRYTAQTDTLPQTHSSPLNRKLVQRQKKPSTCPCRHCISTASNLGRLFLRLSSSFWVKLLLASCFHRYAEVNGKLRNHFRNVIVEPRPIGTPSFSNSISQTSRISRLRMRVMKWGGEGWLLLCFSCLQNF